MLKTVFNSKKGKQLRFNSSFSVSTVCILAGSPSADYHGAQLIKHLKKNSSANLNFIGIGGFEMEQAGLTENYANINSFLDKPLYPFKNFLRIHVERCYHPVMATIHNHNRKVRKEMNKNEFLDDIKDIQPDAIITLGNEFFMGRVLKAVTGLYDELKLIKPPTFHSDKLVINQTKDTEDFLDHFFYSIPREPLNWQYYKFPSTAVGVDGVYRAFRYLYSQSPEFQSCINSDNTILLSRKHNREIMETLIEQERLRFRAKHKIPETQTLIFCAPGNREAEVNWTVDLLRNGVQEFLKLDKIKPINSDNFTVVITASAEHPEMVRSAVNSKPWPVQTIVVQSEQEKFSAMAASDFGLALNGDIVAECAAFQLPVAAVSKIPWLQAYFTLLYNSFNVDLNIGINGEAYPELLGQAFGSKLAETFEPWLLNPKTRYRLAERYDNLLYNLVPLSGSGAQGSRAVVLNNREFTEHTGTYNIMSKKILQADRKSVV